MTTRLIVGLGNKGQEYAKTRHNAGFILIDSFAAAEHISWQEKPKFKAHIAEFTQGDDKIILVKPTTYMNLSGEAVRAIKDFYKIENQDILVIHDELALPFGTIRTRVGGSDAGNNGIKSLIQHIGADFARIRIGILDDEMPIMGATDFVLDRFDPEELKELETGELQRTTRQLIDDFIAGTFEHTTHTLDA
ncbi:MAG TPA: aminoacyl-tRNA hydrolase [Candidatus Saccharimonadales bacterium]|nr:aminoacyl-tRNA hydrolase [Candidatus Saccharimonadales bacterium]